MSEYHEKVVEAFGSLTYDQKTFLIQKALTDLSDRMESDGFVMIGLLLKEANDRISNGGAPTG